MSLRDWLLKFNFTVTAFAKLMNVHRTYVHKWMKGRRIPSTETMKRITHVTLGHVKTVEELLEHREK